MNKVFVVGGASVDKIIFMDHLPEPKPVTVFSKDSYIMVGSTGCGKALSMQKLGMDTTFHAMLGADKSAELIKDTMEDAGIRFLYDIDPKGTEEHVNLMDDNGGRISIYTQYATFEPEIDLDKLEGVIKENDYIVLNIINYARRLISIAKQYKKEIWCDIHDYDGINDYHTDFIEAADYIFMSSDSIADYQDFMKKLMKKNKKLVVCTHGKAGVSALSSDGRFIELPIIDKYDRINTNGAGDNFFSGFLYAYSKGNSLEKCLQYGTIVAGLCIKSKEIVFPELSEEAVELEYNKYYR